MWSYKSASSVRYWNSTVEIGKENPPLGIYEWKASENPAGLHKMAVADYSMDQV